MVVSAKERILNAAQARLLTGGPTSLVLDAIANDAGVSKGGLLYHFPSKHDLIGGLCDRMLAGFDERLTAACDADPNPNGAWTRAYLDSTVTGDGKPADDSAQLMAGLLASLGRDSEHLEVIRRRFARWHEKLEQDGLDPTRASIVRLAADGLWLSALLGLPQLAPEVGQGILATLRSMTHDTT